MDTIDPKTITEQEYTDRLLSIWSKCVAGIYSSTNWMHEYDFCFKICTFDREIVVYNAFVQLFKTTSQMNITYELYIGMVQSLCRISSYINRFWLKNAHKPDLPTMASRIWKESHESHESHENQ